MLKASWYYMIKGLLIDTLMEHLNPIKASHVLRYSKLYWKRKYLLTGHQSTIPLIVFLMQLINGMLSMSAMQSKIISSEDILMGNLNLTML